MGTFSDSPERLFNAFRGKGTPKKSKIVRQEGVLHPFHWQQQHKLHESIKNANIAERAATRIHNERIRRAHLIPDQSPCPKRGTEFYGHPAQFHSEYSVPPVLIQSKPKGHVYELVIASETFCCFTDVMEAQFSLKAMRFQGHKTAYVRQL